MVANSNASRFGFVAIVVALAATLGGCAESVGRGPVGVDRVDHRNAVTLSRLEEAQIRPTEEIATTKKLDETRIARNDAKHGLHVAAEVR
jgi:hypothetical protein